MRLYKRAASHYFTFVQGSPAIYKPNNNFTLSTRAYRSISQRELERMNRLMEQDVMIRALHDVKGIDIGTGLVRYKAEVDFDGRELTRAYLDKQDTAVLLQVGKGEERA